MSLRVERWRYLVAAVLRSLPGPKPTHAELLGQIHAESNGNPHAESGASAVGLMQVTELPPVIARGAGKPLFMGLMRFQRPTPGSRPGDHAVPTRVRMIR